MRNVTMRAFVTGMLLIGCLAATEAVGWGSEGGQARVMVVLDLASDDLDPRLLQRINEKIAGVLRTTSGASLITQAELARLMQFGKESRDLGCTSTTRCIVDISRAVHNDLLVGGRIGRVGKVWTVTLHLVDARQARIVARSLEEVQYKDALVEAAGRAAGQLVADVKDLVQPLAISIGDLGPSPKLAVMEFAPSGVDGSLADNIADVVTVELKQFEGVQVISRQEIATMLNFEAVKQGVNCTEESCLIEIGAALGVRFLVAGSIGRIEETYLIGIKVIDIRMARIVGREQEMFVGPADGLLPAARFCLRRVLGSPYHGDGLIKITASEKAAAVSLDGKPVGLTPDLTLPATIPSGKYRVDAAKDGFYPLMQDLYVEPARQTQVQLVLAELPLPWWKTWWFWTITGVVVAGAVTTGVVFGTMDAGSPGPNSGTIVVPAQ